ncbi:MULTISPECIES: hypothetical protein [Bosea]|uniref:hypothetical protein n=1 Tax=Bosea TaxID=85413 RepID=UPI00214FC418|nr:MULTISPECIES: hypothetical protein [Bosea]MCR4522551.1 hypothetical protein [Bosea sp. 47.2.35]MDR6827057.1 hypothetical protein [Bosea robiniae]MDR6893767.1 hypothetical protein [Bosea sp. BE109]MDR7136533.1 hypothetical protein [Bosea sp. BE168]MDR7173232.1 hypothetical protein [Bosea sp. BE271]
MSRLARTVMLMLGLLAASQASAVERLTGDQIKQLFEGNTVSGRYSGSNLPFSEYHHPDGRASGHNRHLTNTDACWTTTQDSVCYYYGPQEKRRTYCFAIETSGELIVIRSRPSGRINGLARVEKGDPYSYAAKRSDWVCDGLISQVPGRSKLARR